MTYWRFLKKLKIELPCNPTPRHIPREKPGLKGYMHSSVVCSTIYNSQNMEVTSMSVDRWMDEKDGILLSHYKEWNNAICSNIDGPRDCQTEWYKSEKEKYHMVLLIYGI